MIMLITTAIKNKQTNKLETVVDYGVDVGTGRNVVLPAVHPSDLGAVIHEGSGEYVIEDDE